MDVFVGSIVYNYNSCKILILEFFFCGGSNGDCRDFVQKKKTFDFLDSG